jgi:hypothetical protein
MKSERHKTWLGVLMMAASAAFLAACAMEVDGDQETGSAQSELTSDVDSGTTVGADGTTVAAPSVTIQDSGNANATVIGVPFCSNINVQADCWTRVNTSFGTPCPSGHFCIYQHTTAAEGGKVFSFFHCRNGGADWALQAWNGIGFYHNSNTGGAHALLKDNNHVERLNIAPPPSPKNAGSTNYKPIWFVQACDR